MRRPEQIAEAKKLPAHLDWRTTALADGIYRNPVSDYTCPEQAALGQPQRQMAAE